MHTLILALRAEPSSPPLFLSSTCPLFETVLVLALPPCLTILTIVAQTRIERKNRGQAIVEEDQDQGRGKVATSPPVLIPTLILAIVIIIVPQLERRTKAERGPLVEIEIETETRGKTRHEKSSKREREVDDSSGKMRAWDQAEETLGGELQKEERGAGRGGRGGKVEKENKRGSDGAAAVESTLGPHDLVTSGRRFSLAFEHPKIDKSSKADSVDDWRLASKFDGLTTAFGPAWKKKGSGEGRGKEACWRLEQLGYCVLTGACPFYHSPGFTGLKNKPVAASEEAEATLSKSLDRHASPNSATSISLSSAITLSSVSPGGPHLSLDRMHDQERRDELVELRKRVTCLERDNSSLEMRFEVLEQDFEANMSHQQPSPPPSSLSSHSILSNTQSPPLLSSLPRNAPEPDLSRQLETPHASQRLEEEIREPRDHQQQQSGGTGFEIGA
ncbi:hypothetical protein BDY24DRAFT_441193 [Mrakia frigida]|uniref:uncharacterized protein n=1 Tax=Mrakia frigida TaxID=29902 RepID=UPI003FCC1B96